MSDSLGTQASALQLDDATELEDPSKVQLVGDAA